MVILVRALQGFAVAIYLAVGVVLATAHPRFLFGTLVGDDAGYYLAIARNACLGHGLSFDRLSPTNGFNPLMPLLLIPLDRWLAPGLDLVACFRIGALVSWVAMGLALLAMARFSRSVLDGYGFPEAGQPAAVAAASLFMASFVALKGYYGMDAFLALAFGLAYLAGVARDGLLSPGRWRPLRDGALLAGTVLARIDSIPLVAAAFALMGVSALRAGGTGRVLARAVVVAALVGPYLAWNVLQFHDWLPISARLKSAFPHWDPEQSLNAVLRTSLNPADRVALFLALAAALIWILGDLSGRLRPVLRDPTGGARAAMGVLALYLVGRLAWLLLFSRMDVQGSYFVLAHPFLLLAALVVLVRAAGAGRALPGVAAVTLLALLLAGTKLYTVLPEVRAIGASDGDEWAIARKIHDVVLRDEVLYGGAFGLIGYAADRPWINGDGVANSLAYQEAIRRGALAAYLKRASVDYVAVAVSPPREPGLAPFVLHIGTPLHAAMDSLWLRPEDIVLRERMRRGGGTEVWLVRWRPGEGESENSRP